MNEKKFKPPEEWMEQAEYDVGTAAAMLESGRYIYAVFMCHLSLEKALKAHFAKRLEENPPKIHNLNYLLERSAVQLPTEYQNFVGELNDKSVPTRYPDVLKRILQDYKEEQTRRLLEKTKEIVGWLRTKL